MAASTTNAKVTPAADNSELELSATTYSQSGNEYYCKVTWNEVSAVSFTESKVKLYVRGSLFSLLLSCLSFVRGGPCCPDESVAYNRKEAFQLSYQQSTEYD